MTRKDRVHYTGNPNFRTQSGNCFVRSTLLSLIISRTISSCLSPSQMEVVAIPYFAEKVLKVPSLNWNFPFDGVPSKSIGLRAFQLPLLSHNASWYIHISIVEDATGSTIGRGSGVSIAGAGVSTDKGKVKEKTINRLGKN